VPLDSRAAIVALGAVFGAMIAACGRTPAANPAPKQATVTVPVKEAQLTTVTLTADAEKRLGIATAAVERKALALTRTVGGEITAPSGQSIAITAPVAGTLQSAGSVRHVAGSRVSKGQLLFHLTPLATSERESVIMARQAIDTATARREAAALKAKRAEQLLKDGAGSRRQLEEAQAELAVAEADLKAARDRRTLAGDAATTEGSVRIEAPQSGVIQAVHVSAGQAVPASTPLLDIVHVATVWVRVPIYAGEARDIDATAPARVSALGASTSADGVIAQPIQGPPSGNATTAAIDFYYAISTPGQAFRPGERVAVALPRRGPANATVVPKASLLHDAYGGTWVYVVREPRVYARARVTVTDINGDLAVLSEGPALGTRVVTDGAAELFGVEFGAGK
jgi:cobalt-zinc-cadmium efflux system membrane fusion protein